jgi:CheY-like chemotaxis protein
LKPVHPANLRRTLARLLGARNRVSTAPMVPAARIPVRGAATILAVEDNQVNQKVIRLILGKLGYAVDVVSNGQEALDALQAKPYGLVLMDEQMPVMDGFTATRLIRQAQADRTPGFHPALRIIAMTANAMTGDREACLNAGMDDYLSKPVKPEALAEMLIRYLPAEPAGNEVPVALAK